MFPKELYAQVDGCMHRLTKTTENFGSQGRIGPTTPSWTSQLRRYVGVTSHRLDRAPTHEARTSIANYAECRRFGRSRPTGLYRTYERDQAVIRLNSPSLFYHWSGKVEMDGRFHPTPSNGVGIPARFVKWM